MKSINPRPRRHPLVRAARSTLALGALAGCLLVTWGVLQTYTARMSSKHGSRPNPWRGLPGCIYLRDHATNRVFYAPLSPAAEAACEDENVRPLSNGWLGQGGEALRSLRDYTLEPASMQPIPRDGLHAPNVLNFDGREIAQGSDVVLTLDAARQPAAQQLANCMTGNDPATNCRGLAGVEPELSWPNMYEGAAARTLGLVEIDIGTGAVVAMASAHSSCFDVHWRAAPASVPSGCPPMVLPAKPAIWRLENHATFTQAMPGSIDKVWLMTALLRSDDGPWLRTAAGSEWMKETLKHSRSEVLFDKLLCAERGFPRDCSRTQHLAAAADALGMNGDEIALLPGDMGKAKMQVPGGQLLMVQTDAGHQWMSARMPDSQSLVRCRARAYRKCTGEQTASLVSELWGQGNALATPLSAARMMARLGAAANGQVAYEPHLLDMVAHTAALPAAEQVRIAQADAGLVARSMGHAHRRGGTAHASCSVVLGTAACDQIMYVSSKTGTPSFGDTLKVEQRSAMCIDADKQFSKLKAINKKLPELLAKVLADCGRQPYKWYVMLVRDGVSPNAPYTRAIAVAAERNWRLDGYIDGAGDQGVNVAAELAWRYLTLTQSGVAIPSSKSTTGSVRR